MHPAKQLQFGEPPFATCVTLHRQRFVSRRGTTDGRGDEAIAQLQAVAASDGGRPVGEAGPVQGGEQEIARPIAGKDPSSAVAAVGRRGQAEDEHASRRIAEPRNRPAPVFLIPIRGPV